MAPIFLSSTDAKGRSPHMTKMFSIAAALAVFAPIAFALINQAALIVV